MFEIDGISVVLLIVGLVELVKRLGLKGNVLTLVSVIIGVLVGLGFKAYGMFPDVKPWVELAVSGIAFGLAATGLYDLTKNIISRDVPLQ